MISIGVSDALRAQTLHSTAIGIDAGVGSAGNARAHEVLRHRLGAIALLFGHESVLDQSAHRYDPASGLSEACVTRPLASQVGHRCVCRVRFDHCHRVFRVGCGLGRDWQKKVVSAMHQIIMAYVMSRVSVVSPLFITPYAISPLIISPY